MTKLAIFGFGGRCVNLLLELINLMTEEITISAVAIHDPYYYEVYDSISIDNQIKLQKILSNAKIYKNETDEELIYKENDFDVSFICSQNYKHYDSLLLAIKYNKHIFCEKPVVHKLEQLLDIKNKISTHTKSKQIGLTLRYSKLAEIAVKHLPKLGQLYRIYGREFVNIGHAVHFMTSWRRDKSLSGGLGLEKIVHDYDLLFYFIEKAFNIPIDNISISGIDTKDFWTKSNEQSIMDAIDANKQLYECYHKWDNRIQQRTVLSPFDNSNLLTIIPDYQHVMMHFNDSNIDLEFEVSIAGFRTKTVRYYEFYGSNGKITIDVISSLLMIDINDNDHIETIFLEGDGTSHSGGDHYLMNEFLSMINNQSTTISTTISIPTFEEAIRATHIGILCENAIDNKHTLNYMKTK